MIDPDWQEIRLIGQSKDTTHGAEFFGSGQMFLGDKQIS
jgi:hypothetical protein